MKNANQQHQPDATLDLPETLDTADAKLAYLYLRTKQSATIDELHTALGMKKITLYPLLRTLTATDHVDLIENQYICQQAAAGGDL